MKKRTKAQISRERRYREQLKRCGFRSWKRANWRRTELIMAGVQSSELTQLQVLTDLYVAWKTNDQIGRETRSLDRMLKKILNK
jgi:hypothetical protein